MQQPDCKDKVVSFMAMSCHNLGLHQLLKLQDLVHMRLQV